MFCSCSPTAKEPAPIPPPPRPPVPSESQRLAGGLAGVPYSDAASTPVAVKSSVADVSASASARAPQPPRPARRGSAPAAPAPRTPPRHRSRLGGVRRPPHGRPPRGVGAVPGFGVYGNRLL